MRQSLNRAQLETFCVAVGNYLRASHRSGLFVWIGGEPFTWSDLGSVSRFIRDSAHLKVAVVTNASAIARRAILSDLRLFHEITISIDGDIHTHARLRRIALRRADEIFEFTASLPQSYPGKVRLSTIICRSNFETIDTTWRTLAAAGVREICINCLYDNGEHAFFREESLDASEWETFRNRLPGIRTELRALGCELVGSDWYIERIGARVRRAPMPVRYCWPGHRTIFIEPSGNFSTCAYTTAEFGSNIAEVKSEDDFARVLESWKDRRSARMFSSCYDCPDTNVFGKFDSWP